MACDVWGLEAEPTPDYVGTSNQALKLQSEQGGVGRLCCKLRGAVPPCQPLSDPDPHTLPTVKKLLFQELDIWGTSTKCQAQNKARGSQSNLTTAF